MLNIIPVDKRPLENPEDCAFSRMAFDSMYFYCCTGKSNKIFKFTIQGALVCCVETARTYCSICFDCTEKCFWAITSACRSSIYKLNDLFREIGSIRFPFKDNFYHDISYDAPEDILLLCGINMVVKVSKSGTLLPLYSGEKDVHYEAATRLFDNYLISCKFHFCAPDIIGILCKNACFDYLTCMPKQFSLNSMCVGYGCGGCNTLFILATQSYQYAYLLTYRVENGQTDKKCCQPICCEGADDEQSICISIDKMDMQTDIII